MSASNAPPAWSNPNSSPLASSEVHEVPSAGDDDFLTRPYSTLDEPVMETIMRDARSVGGKLRVVLFPLSKAELLEYNAVLTEEQIVQSEGQKKVLAKLRDWDLWGPLIVCLSLSILLSMRAPINQAPIVFSAVFCSMSLGSAIVTINAQLLGGAVSFFQSVCILGYCVFPFVLSALLIAILKRTWFGHVWINFIWVFIGFIWATRASSVFIGQYIKRDRRFLAVFPVFFYYSLLGWLVLLF